MTFLQRYKRSLLIVLIDCLAITTAWLCAFFLRYNLSFSGDHWPRHAIIALPLVLVVQLIANSFKKETAPEKKSFFKWYFLGIVIIILLVLYYLYMRKNRKFKYKRF